MTKLAIKLWEYLPHGATAIKNSAYPIGSCIIRHAASLVDQTNRSAFMVAKAIARNSEIVSKSILSNSQDLSMAISSYTSNLASFLTRITSDSIGKIYGNGTDEWKRIVEDILNPRDTYGRPMKRDEGTIGLSSLYDYASTAS